MKSARLKLTVPVEGLTLALLLLAAILCYGNSNAAATVSRQAGSAASPPAVLVELFTSEGCSSCPPADRLLADLDQRQLIEGVQVIVLSEHVDYWNRLGWRDPFSSAAFSQRQLDYARALGAEDVYTPQMVVDGQAAFVGGKADAAREAISKAARAPKAEMSLTVKAMMPKAVRLEVQVAKSPQAAPGDAADVMLAIAESGLLSNVTRGENSGRKLLHVAVTRKLIRIGTLKGGSFSAEPAIEFDAAWKRQNLKAIAFVQERTSRRVLGAAAIRLAGE